MENKCSICDANLPRGRRHRCKVCAVTVRRYRIKKMAVEYKGGKCQKCGFDSNIASLQFHHKDPNKKDFLISNTHNKSWISIKNELDKCELLCANCHIAFHSEKSNKFYEEANLYYGYQINLKIFEAYQSGEINKINRTCKDCGAYQNNSKSRLCRKCSSLKRRVVPIRPSKDELSRLVLEKGYKGTSRIYGVSDNTIRRWMI